RVDRHDDVSTNHCYTRRWVVAVLNGARTERHRVRLPGAGGERGQVEAQQLVLCAGNATTLRVVEGIPATIYKRWRADGADTGADRRITDCRERGEAAERVRVRGCLRGVNTDNAAGRIRCARPVYIKLPAGLVEPEAR